MRRISLLFCLLLMLCMGNFELIAQTAYTPAMGSQQNQPVSSGPGGIFVLAPGPDLNVFTTLAAFNAASVGATLTSEDFEDSINGDGSFCQDAPPLSSATNDACYATNALAAGFSFTTIDDGGLGSLDYVALGSGFLSIPNDVVGPVTFANESRFDFSPSVTAAHFSFVTPLTDDDFEVEVFNGGTSLGTFDISSNGNTPVFGGFTTNNQTPVTHITVTDQNGNTGELFTDITFGQLFVAPPVAVEPIPTMSEWGLMIFGLLVLNLGLMFIYKQRNILS